MRQNELYENFQKELKSIEKYTNLLKYSLKLPSNDTVDEIIERLNMFIEIEAKEDNTLREKLDIYIKSKHLIDNIVEVYNQEFSKCKEINIYDDMHNKPFEGYDQNIMSWIFDFGYYEFYNHENYYNVKYSDLKQHLTNQLEELLDFKLVDDDFRNYLDKSRDNFDDLIDHCIEKIYYSYLDELEYICDYFDELETKLKANDISDNTNIYKQGFLSLMYLFDHYTFEFTRVLLEEKFFEFYKNFAKKDQKSALSTLKSATSLEEFIDEEVESTLKLYYIKELIILFKTKGIILKPIESIVECINRRNIHVHKNGIADDKYCESYNVFSKKIGDYLEIDENYYSLAFNEVKRFISDIFIFVEKTLNDNFV